MNKDFSMDMKSLKHYQAHGAILALPDQFVGILEVKDKIMHLEIEPRDNVIYKEDSYTYESQNETSTKNVLVILESPHRLEFDASLKPVAMMMGKTGCLFFEQFCSHLSNSIMPIKEGIYHLIVCNAVQDQTSCGLNPINREIRDLNWLEIYIEKGGEAEFMRRISLIKPKYTLNLCTGGKNPNGLRMKVNHTLLNLGLIKNKHFTEGNHPSSWMNYHHPMIE